MKQRKIKMVNRAIWRVFSNSLPKKVDSRQKKELKRFLVAKVNEMISSISDFKSPLRKDSAEIRGIQAKSECNIKPSPTIIESLQHAKTKLSGD